MKSRLFGIITCALLLCACKREAASAGGAAEKTLAEARQGFQTTLTTKVRSGDAVEPPPPSVFQQVTYPSPVGPLAAYVSPPPNDSAKHPAIVWITGGDCNTIGDVWSDAPADNDQTAAVYRKSGILMMFPSLRGGNRNPGQQEGFYGEVDDIIAAADYLAKRPGVDPDRIYLGGHSTGGTLVLLVSEYSDRFRAVFSFGPVDNPRSYGRATFEQPWDLSNPIETDLRSPIRWLAGITKPTFLFEGTDRPSNIDVFAEMRKVRTSAQVHLLPVPGHSHFSVLAPVNALIARKILADTGPECTISFSNNELKTLR